MVSNAMSRGASLAAQSTGQRQATCISQPATVYHTRDSETIRIFDGSRYLTVGTLDAGGVFLKRMKPEHILRTPPAIAIQADALEKLAQRGCVGIRAEIADGRTLVVSFEEFQRHALYLNRGYGEQWALPLTHWHAADAVQRSLFQEVAV